MKQGLLQPLAIGVIGVLSGLMIGKRDRVEPEPDPKPVVAPAPTAPPAIAAPRSVWLETLAGAAISDLPAMYSAASGDPERLNLVARYWTRVDPAGFLAHLLADDPPFFSNPAHAAYLFLEWGRRNFLAALDAARTIPAFNPQRDQLLKLVIRSGMESDPESAVAAMTSMRGASGSSSWYAPDPESAKAAVPLLAKLPRTGTLEMTLQRNVALWGQDEPKAAINWALDYSKRELRGFDQFLHSVFYDLAAEHPQVTLDALSQLSHSIERAKAARTIAVGVARKMPEKAIELIEQHGKGWNLYETAGHTAEELSEGKEPELGTNFALMFNDPDARRHAIERSVATYYGRDREALTRWAASIENPARRSEVDRVIATLDERHAKKNQPR